MAKLTYPTTLLDYQERLDKVKTMLLQSGGLRVVDYGDSANYYLHLTDLLDDRQFLLSLDWQAQDTHWNLWPIPPGSRDGTADSVDAFSIDVLATDPADKVQRIVREAIAPTMPDRRDVFTRALSVIEESEGADEHADLIRDMRLLVSRNRI